MPLAGILAHSRHGCTAAPGVEGYVHQHTLVLPGGELKFVRWGFNHVSFVTADCQLC
jgi:hypothetical protein